MPVGLSAQRGENAHIYPGELIFSLATELENEGGNLRLDQLEIKQVFPSKLKIVEVFNQLSSLGWIKRQC